MMERTKISEYAGKYLRARKLGVHVGENAVQLEIIHNKATDNILKLNIFLYNL